jgi:hypothetical protein
MSNRIALVVVFLAGFAASSLMLAVFSHESQTQPTSKGSAPPDAIADAQTPKEVSVERPEQKKTAHDLSDIFTAKRALPSSEALVNQPEQGGMNGFDFYRDPLGAMKPGMTFETNGHTSAQIHINPDTWPEQRRMRLDTVSLRGVFNQHIHGSKRSLRSVEDFTEFEQRTAAA